MAKSNGAPGKKVRFAKVVAQLGKPHAHTLWIAPEKDSELNRALKANRVMMVEQSAGGGKADYGTVGFDRARAEGSQILIFPKSLKALGNAKVVGINFDLIEQPKLEVVPAKKPPTKQPRRRETRPKAVRPSSARIPDIREITPPTPVQKTSPAPPVVDHVLVREVRSALKELEGGKTVAARSRLLRALKSNP